MTWWLGIDKFNNVVKKITEDFEDVLIVNNTKGTLPLVDEEDLIGDKDSKSKE